MSPALFRRAGADAKAGAAAIAVKLARPPKRARRVTTL
jgi:hypothetical protein